MTVKDYVNVILDGCGVETCDRLLSVCDLSVWDYLSKSLKKRYQVHCEHSKCRISELYSTPEEAVTRFLEVRSLINE